MSVEIAAKKVTTLAEIKNSTWPLDELYQMKQIQLGYIQLNIQDCEDSMLSKVKEISGHLWQHLCDGREIWLFGVTVAKLDALATLRYFLQDVGIPSLLLTDGATISE